MVLTQLISRLQSLDENLLLQFTREVLEDNRALLEDYNALQLKQGLRADGSTIEPEYTPFTKAIKQAKGQPTDRVTLQDTGAFWESIHADIFNNSLFMDATDSKTNELAQKYGEGILGLSDEHQAEFIRDYLRNELLLKIRRHLAQ